MHHCQIQCNFGSIDDLCKLGKEYLTTLTCKLSILFCTKFWNFWRITRLSIISGCKVIWSQRVQFFGPPCTNLYAIFILSCDCCVYYCMCAIYL